jgi:hypothetical protein
MMRKRIQYAAFASIRVGISRGQRMRAFLPPSAFLLPPFFIITSRLSS